MSVRIERVHELPAGQRVVVVTEPHGPTIVYMLAEDITDEAACCLADGLTLVVQRVYCPVPAGT